MFDSVSWFWVAFWVALGLLCAISFFFGGPPLVLWLWRKAQAYRASKKEEKDEEEEAPKKKEADSKKKSE